MSGEWLKSTVLDLIKSYKEHENLYNPRDKLYYNKQARNRSLNQILNAVQRTKPDATINEVIKKIQILRTQFGQEIQKIEKSKQLGDELYYVPKIWWFELLQFIAKYMKMRSQPSTPLSVKLEQQQKLYSNDTTNDNTEMFELVEEANNLDEDLEPSDEDLNKSKRRKIEFSPNIINSSLNQNSDSTRTIEYIINEELNTDDHDLSYPEHKKNMLVDSKKFKRKSKAFGNYVACLMQDITDDKLFFEAQNEILKIIEKTSQKMVQK